METPAIDRLRDARGRFSMLAIDQRESLRQMLGAATGEPVGDDALVAFKTLVVRTLTPHASGVLIDRDALRAMSEHAQWIGPTGRRWSAP